MEKPKTQPEKVEATPEVAAPEEAPKKKRTMTVTPKLREACLRNMEKARQARAEKNREQVKATAEKRAEYLKNRAINFQETRIKKATEKL